MLTDLLDAKQVAMATRPAHVDNPWAIRNPLDEASDLYRMVRCGSCAIREIRELIAVPKDIREALLAYSERYPEDADRIHCVLLFRERVAREFERLIEAGAPPTEPPEVSTDDLPIDSEDLSATKLVMN